MRVGLGNSANADPPGDGCFIEKLAADTQWFGVTRASAAQGRTAALGTVTAAAWVKLVRPPRVRHRDRVQRVDLVRP